MSLKHEIERELGLRVRVRAGAPGALDVYADGEQIYSKKKTGHAERRRANRSNSPETQHRLTISG